MKKHRAPIDPEALQAARRAIAEERERRNAAKGEPLQIITGVPKDADWGNWKAEPEQPRDRYNPHTSEAPRAVSKPAPATVPKEWRYVWAQLRAPRNNDPGQIAEGQYGVSGGVLYLNDINGNAIVSQQLRPDDNPLAVATRLLREKTRGGNSSAPAGFYDPIHYTRTFH